MPYAKPNRTSTTPRPTRRRPHRPIDIAGPQNPTATIISATGTWNFAARIWIAFDPRSSISPNWIDISTFVETESPITITHGRGDGLSDVSATTCTLNVDLTDGRFFSANKAGIWYGLVGKGNWLKVDIFPPSGIVSTRFVGFLTSLPDQVEGDYQYGTLAASDRFEGLGRAPAIISMMQSEVLTDPNVAGNVKGYWNLHEDQGSLTFGDTSGQGARYLQAVGLSTQAGIGMAASNVDAPGFDGLRAVTFSPVSATQGTYLTAPITSPTGTWTSGTSYTGLTGVLSFWYQSTNTGLQTIANVIDPTSQFAIFIFQDPNGNLYAAYSHISTGYIPDIETPFGGIADGKWHHVALSFAATNQLGGACITTPFLDGQEGTGASRTGITGANGNFSQLIIGGGYSFYAPGTFQLGAGNICDVSWYWADANIYSDQAGVPNFPSHYAAGVTGFAGESTDTRIGRLARYAGIPINTKPANNFLFTGTTPQYASGLGPWTNLSTGAHVVGTQSVAGRKPLDPMLEAAHTEGMPLYENRSGYLEMQPSTARQNTSPAWSIDAHDLDPATKAADDFAYTTNQVTVTPNGGAAQTVVGAAGSPGRLSQAKYDICDGSQNTASVNAVEAQSLGLGIIQLRADPGPRFAPLAVEAATTALLPSYGSAWYDAVLATEISTPIRVTNAPVVVGGGNCDVLVEGWTETITSGNHLFQFNVSPVQGPTYQLDDAVLGHIDTDGSTLAGGTLNTTALSFQVATTNAGSPLWTTAGADFPFDIRIDGEQITISGISGAASPQTFTASARSVNGVVASHNVGAAVSLWQPLTLAY